MSTFAVEVVIPAQTLTPVAQEIPERTITVQIDLAALAEALSTYITTAAPEG